MSLLYLQRW